MRAARVNVGESDANSMKLIYPMLLGLLAVSTADLVAGDVCELTIRVLNDSGQPRSSTLVELLAPNGTVVESGRTNNGTVRFCDLGFGTHSVRVGEDECDPVTIARIAENFQMENTITVTKHSCSSGYESTARSCPIHIRVRSVDGPLPQARLTFPGIKIPEAADKYGRVSSALLTASNSIFTISMPGYSPTTVSLSCEQTEPIERTIVLRPDDEQLR